MATLATLVLAAGCATAASLQQMIDSAAEGSTVEPPEGVYSEHLHITKAIVLDGKNGVIIDGGGQGTVVELETSKATLKNLTIRNSGHLHNAIDAGLRVKGDNNIIKDIHIENALFGVDFHQANSNILRRSDIASTAATPELRGDSIRLWYSHGNELDGNNIHDARDFVVWYSHDNKITGNTIHNGRYGLHFMYADGNVIEKNEIADCVVGVFLMYSNGVTIHDNHMLRSWGASGVGIGLKDSSDVSVSGNQIVGNAIGLSLDLSPPDKESTNRFEQNQVAYNGVGVEFNTEWTGNEFMANSFNSNFTQVSVHGGGTALQEAWKGNYWDDFAGSDQDGDGRGDSPFEIYSYADRIWMEYREANFFRGGLALEALDFVERLAPFSEPRLLVREPDPLMSMPVAQIEAKPKGALEMLQ